MKLKITATEYENLSDELKALYVKRGGVYVLDLEDEVYTADEVDTKIQGLETKNQELLDEKKKAERKALIAQQQKDEEEGNYKSLYESAQAKITELENSIQTFTKKEQTQAINNAASKIASELCPNHPKRAKLLERFVREHLSFHEGKVVVTNESGQPTVSSFEDLKNKLRSSGDYDDLIEAPGGNGGNENGDKKNNGGKVWSDYNSSELSEIRKTNPAQYEKLKSTRGK